jgi:hypothetical protein
VLRTTVVLRALSTTVRLGDDRPYMTDVLRIEPTRSTLSGAVDGTVYAGLW